MLPSPWIALVLALAVFRLCRLAGWDDFPPVVRARAWAVGAELSQPQSANQAMRLTNEPTPEAEWRYRRPLLAHLIACAYCLGFWISFFAYGAWLLTPRWTLYALAPWALSAAVGIIARTLDP